MSSKADVGLALLVGHASTNTTEELTSTTAAPGSMTSSTSGSGQNSSNSSGNSSSNKDNNAAASTVSAEDILNARDKELQQRGLALNNARVAHMKVFE